MSPLEKSDELSSGRVQVFVERPEPPVEKIVVAPASAACTESDGTSGCGNGLEITVKGEITAIIGGARYKVEQFGRSVWGDSGNVTDLRNLREALDVLIEKAEA